MPSIRGPVGRFDESLPASGSGSASTSGTSFIARGLAWVGDQGANVAEALFNCSRANARWATRSAAAAEARSTRTLILISLVVIIWMLMPAAARTSNSVVATPVWVRMPRPTTETLATSASWVTEVAPISREAASAARSVSGRSPLATVKLTSVVPPLETF